MWEHTGAGARYTLPIDHVHTCSPDHSSYPQLRAGQSSKQVQERGPGSADRHDLTNTEDWFECTLHHMGAVCAKYLTSPSLSIFIVLPNMA